VAGVVPEVAGVVPEVVGVAPEVAGVVPEVAGVARDVIDVSTEVRDVGHEVGRDEFPPARVGNTVGGDDDGASPSANVVAGVAFAVGAVEDT
jgi:hypothetical protein